MAYEYGLEAIGYWLVKFPKSLHTKFSKEFVLESVKFILENNNLKFDNDYFNQIKATAIGTIFAPTYTNLTMGLLSLRFTIFVEMNLGKILEILQLKNETFFSMTVKLY